MRSRAMTGPGKTTALLQLIRFDKPIGTLLLLWPTLIALWLAAGGVPDLRLLLIFILGTFLMRSAGCVANDLADRDMDGGVARTEARPLVTGSVSVREAITLCLALCLASFVLVLFTNRLTVLLSLAGAVLALVYPFMKRVTHLPQFVLGLAFSWGIPMAFAAQREALPPALWWLFAANLLWTVAYDTQYAMVDRDDDLKMGIKSIAILFGRHDRQAVALLQAACLFLWGQVGAAFGLGTAYWIALALVAGLFCYHQWLIRERRREDCFRAFLHNNWVGLVLFAGVALHHAF